MQKVGRKLAIVVIVASLLTSCSSSNKVESDGKGGCIQKREKSFLGITYGRSEQTVGC